MKTFETFETDHTIELFEKIQNIENGFESLNSKFGALQKSMQDAACCPDLRRDWIPHKEMMQFLGYGQTQMTYISKHYKFATARIGKKVFYSRQQVLEILNKQIGK